MTLALTPGSIPPVTLPANAARGVTAPRIENTWPRSAGVVAAISRGVALTR